jgi:hypothetical protein
MSHEVIVSSKLNVLYDAPPLTPKENQSIAPDTLAEPP